MIFDRLFHKAEAMLAKRKEDQMIYRFGGIQKCPWCRQWAQSEPGWSFAMSPEEPQHDILTCGMCRGTSLWHFAFGMHYVRPIDAPKPANFPREVS